MAQQVADLFADLRLKVDEGSWRRGDKMIGGMQSSLLKMGAGLATFFGLKAAKGALIDFNSTVEDTKNQIAGMLALTKKTSLTEELVTADKLFANLQKRAASLPGTTQEYTKMLGQLARPVTAAGMGMQDLEDLTVSAVVAAKAFGVQWEVAARDVREMLQGNVSAGENQTAAALGITNAKERKKFNAMTAAQRAAETKRLFAQPQLAQLAEAQGKTFSGVLSTLKDSIEQFFGRVGVPLFKALGDQIKSWNEWLAKNQERVKEFAETLAGALTTAFEAVGTAVGLVVDAIQFFNEHSTLAKSLLIGLGVVLGVFAVEAAVAWTIAFAPVIAAIAAIAALVLILDDLFSSIIDGKGVIRDVVNWIGGKFRDLGSAIKGVFVGIGEFFANIARAVRDAFVAVFDWIADKVSWAWDQIKTIGHYITHPWEIVSDTVDFFTGGDSDSAGVTSPVKMATQTATSNMGPTMPIAQRFLPRDESKAAGPRTVNVDQPTTNVTINASGVKADEVIKIAKDQIQEQHDRIWRETHAATGGDDEED